MIERGGETLDFFPALTIGGVVMLIIMNENDGLIHNRAITKNSWLIIDNESYTDGTPPKTASPVGFYRFLKSFLGG
jgi:hypothetical protein